MANEETQKAIELEHRAQARYEQRCRERASDLADQVAAGEITDAQANELMVEAQERWNRELG